jgi:hypothetical protein
MIGFQRNGRSTSENYQMTNVKPELPSRIAPSSPHKSAFSQGDVVRIVTMESFKLVVSDPTLGIQSHTSIFSEYKLIV